jgi:hypothetical protein
VGEEQIFEFTAGEDGSRVAASATPHVSLYLEFRNLQDNDKLSLALNGNPLADEDIHRDSPKAGWLTCRLDPSFLRWGENTLSLKLEERAGKTWGDAALANLEIRVASRPEVFPPSTDEPSGAAGTVDESEAPSGLKDLAFVLTEDDILPPPGKVTGMRQWLLDELNFGRPRVAVAKVNLGRQADYADYPSEGPLPGWSSLAVLFDTDKLPNPCEKHLALTLLKQLDSQVLREAELFAGSLGGTENLAALVVPSRSCDDLEVVASCFGEELEMPGLLPLPIRFMRGSAEGHLITSAFAMVFCGTLTNGTFTQGEGCWEPNRIHSADLAATTWRLE